MTALLAGLVFGVLGSGHCAAMCGPLVLLASPRAAGLGMHPACRARRVGGHAALYHIGRASVYVGLGALAGLVGGALTHLGFGRALALVAGGALVVQAVAATGGVTSRLGANRVGTTVSRVMGRAGAWMRTHPVLGPVLFGALNGLLPCGLLYAALTAAGGFGTLGQSMLFMAAFAAGTTPLLAVIAMAGGSLRSRMPHVARRAIPAAFAIVGLLLIARGVRPPHGNHGGPAGGSAPAIPHVHH
jgi:sulfite exporter TauE/SafE